MRGSLMSGDPKPCPSSGQRILGPRQGRALGQPEGEEDFPVGTGESVVAAVCATPDRVERTAESMVALLGRPAHLVEADRQDLLEQYRVERGLTGCPRTRLPGVRAAICSAG